LSDNTRIKNDFTISYKKTHSDCTDSVLGNLFPNLVVELYFLVQLLTARGGEVEATFVYGGGRYFFLFLHRLMLILEFLKWSLESDSSFLQTRSYDILFWDCYNS